MAKKILVSGLMARRLRIPFKSQSAQTINCDARWVDARRLKRMKRRYREYMSLRYTEYESLIVTPSRLFDTANVSYREACLMNGFDPDKPVTIVFDGAESVTPQIDWDAVEKRVDAICGKFNWKVPNAPL